MPKWILFFFLPLAHAGSLSDKARCDNAINQVQEARLDMPEKGRLDLINSISDDLVALREAAQSKNLSPENHHRWKKCRDRKMEAFEIHENKLTDGARTQFVFFMAKGKQALLQEKLTEATMYFKSGYETRPSDFGALMTYFQTWRKSRQNLLRGQNVNLIEVDAFKKEASDLLKLIIQHPSASRSALVDAHLALYNDLMRVHQEAPAMEELRAVVSLDPTQKEALDRLSSFEINRGRPLAARAFLENLKKVSSLSKEYFAKLAEIQLLQEAHTEALVTTEEGLKKFPNDFALMAIKASALVMNGRIAEAKTLNARLIKIEPKNQRVLDSQSRVFEKEGDLSRAQGFPGKGLAEYKAGLDLSPSRLSLRIKMATLIFDFRRDQEFKPREVTQKDMNEVVRLLLPALDAESPREDVLLLFLQSAKRSEKSAQAVATCQNLEKDPKGFPTAIAVLDCAEILVANQNPQIARRILESAQFSSKFLSSKEKFKNAYLELKKP